MVLNRMYHKKTFRVAVIAALIVIVGLAHWITPVSHHHLHTFHVLFRKLFVLPIILSAIWFEFTGSVLTALIISVIYIPHVLLQWSGQPAENVNQIGEVVTIWVIAVLSGIFAKIEKSALRDAAETHEGSLLAMVTALDAREHDTELHSLRVREYALRLGSELDLDGKSMQILGQASLLHDIGKIGIPDSILLKPGPLDDEQWHIMRQHPEIGRKMLLSVPFLKDAADIVYSHHEHYDGSGYPRGLAGEEIPLGARIFAVVDVYDALNSDRPYRKKMNYEQIDEEIKKGSGSHFDPKVVEAFIQIPVWQWNYIEKQVSVRASYITGRNYNLLKV